MMAQVWANNYRKTMRVEIIRSPMDVSLPPAAALESTSRMPTVTGVGNRSTIEIVLRSSLMVKVV